MTADDTKQADKRIETAVGAAVLLGEVAGLSAREIRARVIAELEVQLRARLLRCAL